jgi:hypothetical protein
MQVVNERISLVEEEALRRRLDAGEEVEAYDAEGRSFKGRSFEDVEVFEDEGEAVAVAVANRELRRASRRGWDPRATNRRAR